MTLSSEILFQIIRDTLTHDILRYVLGAGGVYLIINIVLAHPLAARHRHKGPYPPGQIRRELCASARTIVIFAVTGTSVSLAAHLGIFPIYPEIAAHGWGWLIFSTMLIIVVHDAYFYWMHWMLHRRWAFRRLHRLHHRSHRPTPFTSYAFDPGEAVLNAVFLPAFVWLVPMHPLALLIFVSHMMLRNALSHCGVEVFPARRDGRPLIGWMTTVTHHDLHHRDGIANLGFYFTWWDRWMGTEHPDYLQEFAQVGWHPGRAGPSFPEKEMRDAKPSLVRMDDPV